MDDHQFKDIRADGTPEHGLKTKPENNAIITVLHTFNTDTFDGIQAIQTLRKLSLIGEPLYQEMMDAIIDTENKFEYFFKKTFQLMTFHDFVLLLQLLDFSKLAMCLLEECFKPVYKKPGRVPVPFARRVQNFYKFQKSHVDNKIFQLTPREYLTKVIEGFDMKIYNTNEPMNLRQESLERKVALYVLLVQQSKDIPERRTIMRKLLENVPAELDRRSLDMVYHAKMALTEARAKQIEDTEDHIKQAKIICENCEPCFGTLSLLHDIAYIHRTFHNHDHSPENLKCVLDAGHMAIQSLVDEDKEVQIFWRRLILTYIILCLLRINSVFEMSDIRNIPKVDIERAKQAVKQIERLSGDIETRRKMILSLCKGRVHELDTLDTDIAIAYTKEALSHSEDGTFFNIEVENIRKYHTFLKTKRSKVNRIPIIALCFAGIIIAIIVVLFKYVNLNYLCGIIDLHLFT